MAAGGEGATSIAFSSTRGSGAPRQSHVGGYSSSPRHHHPPSANPHDSPAHHSVGEGAASSGPPTEVSISEASSWILNGGKNGREG